MSTGGTVAIIAIVGAAAAGTGLYFATKKPPTTTSPTSSPPPSSNYTLILSGPSSAKVNIDVTYTLSLSNNGSPVSGAQVTLNVPGQSKSGSTDSNGNARWSIGFTSTGTFSVYGTYNNTKSNTISVTVTSAKPQCTSCSDCPSGYNCAGGKCVELIPQSISVPSITISVPSSYIQHTIERIFYFGDPVPLHTYTALLVFSSAKQACPSSYGSTSVVYETDVKVSGTIKDSNGAGVNGIDVSGSVAGGGGFSVHTGSGDTIKGKSWSSMKTGSATTDCNGNFTLEVQISIDVADFSQPLSGNSTTSYYGIPSSYTLTISSGNLPDQTVIISTDDFVSEKYCYQIIA